MRLVMRRYMHEFGWKHIDLRPFPSRACQCHAQPVRAPARHITAEQFEKSAMVANPHQPAGRFADWGWRRSGVIVPAERVFVSVARARAIVVRRFGLRHPIR